MIAPLVLGGLSALGGIFGRKKKKYMNPQMYSQMFGPEAIGKRTQELVNQIANSPYGQQLMQGAAEQGQTFQNEMAARAAAAGLSPDTGGQSAASDFSVGAAAGAVPAMQRQVTSNLWANAMPIAQGMVDREGQLALSNLAEQNAEGGGLNTLGRLGQVSSGVMSGMGGGEMDWAKMLKRLQMGGVPGSNIPGSAGFIGPVQ